MDPNLIIIAGLGVVLLLQKKPGRPQVSNDSQSDKKQQKDEPVGFKANSNSSSVEDSWLAWGSKEGQKIGSAALGGIRSWLFGDEDK